MTSRLYTISLAVLLAVAVAAGWRGPAVAADEVPRPPIAIIDMQEVMGKAKAAKSVRQERARLMSKYQKQFAQKEKDLRKKDKQLKRQRSVLSPDAFSEKRKSFKQRVAKFQRRVKRQRKAIDKAYARAMSRVQKKLAEVVGDLAKERGANVVLGKNQVFLFAPEMELTDAAVERLNETLPSVAFPEVKVAGGGKKRGGGSGQ